MRFTQLDFHILQIGDVNSSRVQKENVALRVANGMKREVHNMFSAVCPGVEKCLSIRNALRRLRCRGANLFLRFLKVSPPASLPKRFAENIFGAVPASFQGQPVDVDERAVKSHDSGEHCGLLEHGAE